MLRLMFATVCVLVALPSVAQASGEFSSLPPLNIARLNHMQATFDGVIYVFGGVTTSGVTPTTEAYDPEVGEWAMKSDMPDNLYKAVAGTYESAIYLDAGSHGAAPSSSAYAYYPGNDTWSKGASPLTTSNAASVMIDQYLYVIAGIQNGFEVNSVAKYNVWRNSYEYYPTPPDFSPACSAAVVLDGYVYLIGGYINNSPVSHVYRWLLDSTAGWEQLADLLQRRAEHGAVVVDGVIYVFGGGSSERSFSETVEAYDPSKNQWTVRLLNCSAHTTACHPNVATL